MKQLIRSTILLSSLDHRGYRNHGDYSAKSPLATPLEKRLDHLAIFDERLGMKQLIRLTILFCGCAALALAALAGPESLPSGKEMKEVAPAPPPECDVSWTGFYIGLKGGYGWSNGDLHVDQLPDGDAFNILQPRHDLNADGVIGGGEIGFNWQWNHFLVGGAADFFGSDMSDTFHRFVDVPGSTG